MSLFKVDSMCRIDSLKEHSDIKNTLTEMIDDAERDILTEQTTELVTDFHVSNSGTKQREWVDYLFPFLEKHLQTTCEMFGYRHFILQNIWFQQYSNGQNHGWHTHGGNYTNVYYLEFGKDAPKTQMRHMGTDKETEFNVSEGSVLSFPSFIWHKAPEVQGNNRKTIISWNMNLV